VYSTQTKVMGADAPSPPRRQRARSRSRSPPRRGGDGAHPAAAAARPPPSAAGGPRAVGPAARSRWEREGGPGEGEEEEQRREAAGGRHQQRQRRAGDEIDDAPPPAAPAAPPPPPPPLYKPNFDGLSGKLAAEANTVNGVVLKFAPPAEARTCKHPRWRVYVFKDLPPSAGGGGDDDDDDDDDGGGGEGGGGGGGGGGKTRTKKKHQEPVGDPIPLDRYPYYLFGKERRVADIPTDHASCSRQHAVVCFREVDRASDALLPASAAGAAAALAAARPTLPYLVDLETANGTFLNGERVEPGRFYELLDGDVVKFGASTREYVFIRER